MNNVSVFIVIKYVVGFWSRGTTLPLLKRVHIRHKANSLIIDWTIIRIKTCDVILDMILQLKCFGSLFFQLERLVMRILQIFQQGWLEYCFVSGLFTSASGGNNCGALLHDVGLTRASWVWQGGLGLWFVVRWLEGVGIVKGLLLGNLIEWRSRIIALRILEVYARLGTITWEIIVFSKCVAPLKTSVSWTVERVAFEKNRRTFG